MARISSRVGRSTVRSCTSPAAAAATAATAPLSSAGRLSSYEGGKKSIREHWQVRVRRAPGLLEPGVGELEDPAALGGDRDRVDEPVGVRDEGREDAEDGRVALPVDLVQGEHQ